MKKRVTLALMFVAVVSGYSFADISIYESGNCVRASPSEPDSFFNSVDGMYNLSQTTDLQVWCYLTRYAGSASPVELKSARVFYRNNSTTSAGPSCNLMGLTADGDVVFSSGFQDPCDQPGGCPSDPGKPALTIFPNTHQIVNSTTILAVGCVLPKVDTNLGATKLLAFEATYGDGKVMFRGTGPIATGTGAISPGWPVHEPNDVALLVVESAGGQAVTLSDPQGFMPVSGSPQGDNVDAAGSRLTVFWKRTTSANSEVPPTIADPGDHVLAQILVFRGVKATGDPWDATSGSATSGTGSYTFSMPGTTTTVSNDLVICIMSYTYASAEEFYFYSSPLPELMWRTQFEYFWGGSGGLVVFTGTKATAGTFGSTEGQFTYESQRYATMTIALRPEP